MISKYMQKFRHYRKAAICLTTGHGSPQGEGLGHTVRHTPPNAG